MIITPDSRSFIQSDVDLYVANWNNPSQFYRNQASNDNHWLHVYLDPTSIQSPPHGIGVRVTVTANGASQVREVEGGAGYNSQSSFSVEFGFGPGALTSVTIEVRWPSGITETFSSVPDQHVTLREGDGI